MNEEEEEREEEEDDDEEEEEEEGRVCGDMRDTVERVRMRTLAHLQRWAHRHI